jgi:hypothetical protein
VGSGGTVGIGNDAAANTVIVGSTTASASLSLQSGSGGNTTIAGNAAATITIGATAQTGAINMGVSTGALTVGLMNGVAASTQTLNVASGTSATGAQVVNILNGTTPGANTTLNVMCGAASAGTQTVNILATGATRAGAVNIGTGNAGHTVVIGSSNAAGSTTIQAGSAIVLGGGVVVDYTGTAASTYDVVATDYFIGTNSSGGTVNVVLPGSPTTGRVLVVYDATGSAASHTVTITGNGSNISAAGSSASTATLTTAYQSMTLYYNGTIWNAQKIT